MSNYAFGKTEGIYRFRNGGKLKIFAGFDHVPIIEIFMKKDYGKIADNSTIIDIGASTGVFCIYAASTAKNIKIFAFEPSENYFETLKENIELNNLSSSVKCFNNAVSGKNEVREMSLRSSTFIYPSLISDQGTTKNQSIQCVTLEKVIDDNKLEKIDLLKMDCEGAEYDIFENASEELLKRVVEIRMEYHNLNKQDNIERLRAILTSKGFVETYFKPTNEIFGNIWFKHK